MKGIIVAAGYGTRFLPVTKTIPKEMLPLINKPSISFIIEEFIQSGIKDIIIISSRRKKVLEDFFDREIELESVFKKEGATAKLESITPGNARFAFIRQMEMMGTGHALLQAAPLIGDEPVVVAYPDDIHMGDKPLSAQLIDCYKETGCSVLATIHNPPNLERYGVLDLAEDKLHVKGMIEKPAAGQEPSKEVSIGRYLYTPEFFKYLEEGWEKHTGGEYYHLYALQKLMDQGKVIYKETEGERLDTGEPSGFLRATLRYAMQDPELRAIIKEEAAGL
ncbi:MULTISPECIES: UTP--glucose-1-phosphate uridylyltransferase [unclassified Oceanispirochaeta]|uniref:UTP--glucose-1-phosphate uridylyltransferase n=1 Tax=unclassified Oceanispirochaeta TaxID=2635722 RepID=UPI000E08E478|nr:MULTISPECIES: UTP--glucose-1-phosphate uridylyltransferase [unclassified Oceanispirochaeta]MBF9018853.1 UTP--glucose-1-phosphate uridylyltransferase [Oceanispirochaeta sp. M2]NPD75341.1 UTP--glucose-1-phosphate uridylyltransferase [Oceanispirochaeta sp. M1]RDG28810.1 UTP--glucose-1-phosphate uridylyltransferase [Oceanispirochaeta sp. M1]